MTDQQVSQRHGLSIFEPPASRQPAASPDDDATTVPEPDEPRDSAAAVGALDEPPADAPTSSSSATPRFGVVRRGGYDRTAVDAYVARMAAAQADTASAGQEMKSLRAQVADLEQRLAEVDNPTYAGLGGRAAAVLRLAQEEADALRVRAQQAAEQSRTRILREAEALRADAEKEAADIRTVQMQEIEERRASVLAEAAQERSLAHAEAEDILASATRESEQLRLAAQQEVNSLRTSAKREAEQSRAAAERESMEARRALAVDKERLSKEAADSHSNAVAETSRLVQEAESRANGAESRAREAIATATKHREQASAESEKTLLRSRLEAEQIVTAARRQGEQIVRNAEADAERQRTSTQRDVELLQARRDGIVAQLGQLQDVLRSFAGADDVPDAPAANRRIEDAGPSDEEERSA